MEKLRALRAAILEAATHAELEPATSGSLLAAALEFYMEVHAIAGRYGTAPDDPPGPFPVVTPKAPPRRNVTNPFHPKRSPQWVLDALGEDDDAGEEFDDSGEVWEGDDRPELTPEELEALEGAPDGVRNDPNSAADWIARRRREQAAEKITVVDSDGAGRLSLEDVPACFHCNKEPAKYCEACYHERYNRKTQLGTAHKPPDGFILLGTRYATESGMERDGYETIDAIVSGWSRSAGASFFVLEAVPSEGLGVYRVYVYARGTADGFQSE